MTYQISTEHNSERSPENILIARTQQGHESVLIKAFKGWSLRVTPSGYRLMTTQKDGSMAAPMTASFNGCAISSTASLKVVAEYFLKRNLTKAEADFINSLPTNAAVAWRVVQQKNSGDGLTIPSWMSEDLANARERKVLRGF